MIRSTSSRGGASKSSNPGAPFEDVEGAQLEAALHERRCIVRRQRLRLGVSDYQCALAIYAIAKAS